MVDMRRTVRSAISNRCRCSTPIRPRQIVGFNLLLLAIIGVQRVPSADSFNIDTKAPVVKLGSLDSYFGYSVAIHLYPDPNTGATEPVILVGAPRDNVTDPQALPSVKQLVRPGAVYQCPFTSNLRDCRAIEIDREAPTNEEDKNNQWMGVSVVSQGTDNGQALACAHLYRLSEPDKRAGIGKCISMYNDLTEDSPETPCEGRPLMAGNIYAYAFCQAGVSAAIGPDADILIGTPGVYSWRGALFKRFLSESGQEDMMWHSSPVEDPTDGQHGPRPATQYYSVLGMSTKIVNIIGKKWYIGGAPRSKFNGEVLMFRFIDGQFNLEPEHVLHGQQIGSGFGYDIVVADFNGDKKEDIVVSAPFYFAHRVGGAIYVYYHGTSGITSHVRPQAIYSRKMAEQECIKLNCHDARFGLAMTSVGDIDRDGYQDLAVGAPYEGNGAVYIYRGSSHGLRNDPTHVQRISALDVFRTPPRSFGASLIGGIDVDRNGYPDLVVGSFASSSVTVLRARPVVRVTATISSTPERIERKDSLCRVDNSSNICVELRVCFKYEAEPRDWFSSRMSITYQLDADKYSVVKPSRIVFARVESPVLNGTLSMNPPAASASKCNTHLAYIAKHTRDFMNPVTFMLTYKLPESGSPRVRPGEPIDNINDYPVINEAASHINFSVPFAVNCGDDHLCNSNITIVPYIAGLERGAKSGKYTLRVENSTDLILVVTVINSGEDAHQTVLTVDLPESIDYVETISQGVDKQTCSPVENSIFCTVGNPLLSGQRSTVAIRLDIRRVQPSDEQLDFIMHVNTTSLNMNTDGSSATVSVLVLFETDVGIRGSSKPEQVLYSGEVLGESVINTEELIGDKIEFNYEVVNFGKISVSSAILNVQWPYEWKRNPSDKQGKNVLYLLTDPLLIAGDGVDAGYCRYEKDWVNPLEVQLLDGPKSIKAVQSSTERSVEVEGDQGSSRRRRNEPEIRTADSILSGRSLRKPFAMDCDNERVKCHRIECVLGELVPKDSITLRMTFRLWNHTFVEDFADVSEVRISSKGEVRLDSTTNVVQTNTKNDVFKVVLTAIPDMSVQEKEGIPLWIIVVSVIVGVILLSLCIILLWKCGFFKRSRHVDKDDLETHQALRSNQEDAFYN